MKKLSSYVKGKIILKIIEDLNGLPQKENLYILSYGSDESNDLLCKIGQKAGIDVCNQGREAGMVNISEYIEITFDDEESRLEKILNKTPKYRPYPRHEHPQYENEELDKLIKEFEAKHIPSSGVSDTNIGEIFRAIQYIQYRAFNDGDYCWNIGSPSFMSYIFLMSKIDDLNYSLSAYNEENGEYGFQFTNEFISENSWDGKISNVIEHSLAEDANFIKYQIMDLLSNGKIEDSKNKYNSRDFTRTKEELVYRY